MISQAWANKYNINSRQEEKKHETIKNFISRGGKIIRLQAKLMSDAIKYTRPKGSTVKNGIIYDSVQGFFA